MRVHQITSTYSNYMGGASRVVRALHRGLLEQNIESFVFGLMQQRDPDMDRARSLGLKSPYSVRALYGIQRYVAECVKPNDIIHVHLFPPLLYLSILKRLGRIPCHLVCTEHSTSNRRRGSVLGRVLDAITYSGYDRVVAISEGVETELLNWRPGLRGKTKVIVNGVDLPFRRPVQREPTLSLKVVSVGNLRSAKNYDSALQAVALLNEVDFEYSIAGEGEYKETLLRLCKELNIESKVRFLGYVDNITELLVSADIFLMPSRWEGFGLAAVEAMNASLPLVVSNVPGLREIVTCDVPCALLVDPGSPISIAEALRQLLISPDLRHKLGIRGFYQAQRFSVNRMVESHLQLYRDLNG